MSEFAFGPRIAKGGVAFSLWAPGAQRVELVTDESREMKRSADGWFQATLENAAAGTRYSFRINGETIVPDPASRFQPDDISKPSEVINHDAYRWRAAKWRGRPWEEAVFLETHVGTFTEAGTYRAMIDKLDTIVASGITALELMPLADFPGARNWGYDGVLWYAPDSAYGRPEDLKALIDEAHLRGLMVFLDVVYNHFGPDGNYLSLYAPEFFSESHTPWGSAINYEKPEVRAFAVQNAIAWLRDYRFDGLRLDAVHAIVSKGEVPMLHDLSRAVGALAAETGRQLHLVLENDDNQSRLLDPVADPPAGKYRAQWNDDYHHAWHVFLSGEKQGYYSDYAPDASRHLARTLASGFAYQGEASPHREGVIRGEPSGDLPPTAFINFLQNHDQIGNRALGDRLEGLTSPQSIEAALAITLLAPMIPMLFMGEEWGTTAPFPFFCDFQGDLAEAVRAGRRKEFAAAYAKYGDDVPDPLAETTFQAAKLPWKEREGEKGKARLDLVTQLLAIRKREIVPRLAKARFGAAEFADQKVLVAQWLMGDGTTLRLSANLSDKPAPAQSDEGRTLWGEAANPDGTLPPWSVAWRLEAAR